MLFTCRFQARTQLPHNLFFFKMTTLCVEGKGNTTYLKNMSKSRLFAPKQPPPQGGPAEGKDKPPATAGGGQQGVASSCYLLVKPLTYKDPVWAGTGTRRILGRLDTFPVPRITPFEALPLALFLGSKDDGDVGFTVMLAKTLALPSHVAPFVTYYSPTTKDKTLGLANEVASILKHTDAGRGAGTLHHGGGAGTGGKFPRMTLVAGRGWEAENTPRTEESVTSVWTMSLILGSIRFWNTTNASAFGGKWFDCVSTGGTTSGGVGGYGSVYGAPAVGYTTGGGRRLDGKEDDTPNPFDHGQFGSGSDDDEDDYMPTPVRHHRAKKQYAEAHARMLAKIPEDTVCGSYLGAALVSGSLDMFRLCLQMFKVSETFDPLPQCLGKAAGMKNGQFLGLLVASFPPQENDLIQAGNPHSPLKVACETGLEEQVLNLLYSYVKSPRQVVNAEIFKIPNFSNRETLVNVAIYYNQRSLAHRLLTEISPETLDGLREEANLPPESNEEADDMPSEAKEVKKRPPRRHRRRYHRVHSDDSDSPPPTDTDDSDAENDGDDDDYDYEANDYYDGGMYDGEGTHKRYGSHPIDTAIESVEGPDLEMVSMMCTRRTEYYVPPVPESALTGSIDPERTRLLHIKRHQKLGLGLKVDHRDDKGFTFLHKAALKKSLPMIKLLLEVARRQHADDPQNRTSPEDLMTARTYGDSLSPLHSAAEVGDAEMVRFFLGNNDFQVRLDPETATGNSWTPLHFAGNSNAVEAAKVLIENGARVSLPDIEGDTALGVSQSMFEVYPVLKQALEDERR